MCSVATVFAFSIIPGWGCGLSGPMPQEIESELQSRSRTVVREATFTLHSPYDEPTTAEHAAVVRAQEDLVRRLFEDAGAPAVRVYLVPTATNPGLEAWSEVSREGFGGGAFKDGFLFVYVRAEADPASAMMSAAMGERTLRHELAHVHARRAWPARGSWFQEGLAREVERMRVEEATLRPSLFPMGLIAARTWARPGSAGVLLDWELWDDLETAERALRYDASQALFRFLVERQAEGSWLQRVRVVGEMPDAEVAALEAEWLGWLRDLDALERIRAGVRSSSPRERSESAGLLPILAEQRARELFRPEADQLALGLLADPATAGAASTFLMYFRARELSEADVADLCASDDPVRCLTGTALRARRGEPFDLDRARAAWSRLSQADRAALAAQRSLIPGLVER
jgi:hypothetical protein